MSGEAVLRVEALDPFEHPKTVKIPRDTAESLGIHSGDVVELRVGERATVAGVKVSRWLRGVIQMSYSLGLTLRVRRGEEVSLSFRRVKPEPARKVVLELEGAGRVYEFVPTPVVLVSGPFPAAGMALTPRERDLKEYIKEGLRYIKRMMLNAPYVRGDYIVMMPDLFTWLENVIVLRITETEPDTAVYVDRDTVLEIV